MDFLSIIIGLLVLRHLGTAKAFHHDAWFYTWVDKLTALQPNSLVYVLCAIGAPVFIVLLVDVLLGGMLWGLVELVLSVIILLYSIGRGSYKSLLNEYKKLWQSNHITLWALESIEQEIKQQYLLDEPVDETPEEASVSSQSSDLTMQVYRKHIEIRQQILYAGFQRVFAVLFWFAILGPVGALAYRLLLLLLTNLSKPLNNDSEGEFTAASSCLAMAEKGLHLFEWPAAKVLALSYAVIADFVRVLKIWLSTLTQWHMSVKQYVHSVAVEALGLQAQWQSKDYIEARSDEALCKQAADEIQMILDLYKRSLICALLGIAFLELLI